MSWTVYKIGEDGSLEKGLQNEFIIENWNSLNLDKFKLIKYLDQYGDTVFNSLQLDDLINDLRDLEKMKIKISKNLNELIQIILECKKDTHSYIKFFGD
jgi:hypothetical protein